MYISKYYTCEEIDQRLLQGYYDDFVKAGFVGSQDEFFKFVLSISDKVDKEPGKGLSTNDFTDELKAQLESLKTLSKVSELENDLNYQTADDVKAAIDSLIGGAPEILDTLKELADALGDDPNFATNITNKLTDILGKLNDEVARAREAETNLDLKIDNLGLDTNSKLESLENKITDLKTYLDSKLESLQEKFETLRTDLNDFKIQEAQDIAQAREYAHGQIDRESDRAQAAEADLQSQINDLNKEHTKDISDLSQRLTQETSERREKDQSLTDTISSETNERRTADQTLQQNIDKEVQDRKDAISALESKLGSDLSSNQTELNSKIDTEISDRKAGDLENKNAIAVEAAERKAADEILQHHIDDLRSDLERNESSLDEKLNQEIQNRKEADADLDSKKVDKREGYGLSKNDFTDELLRKLNSIEEKANHVEKLSELVNDLNFQTKEQVDQAIESIIDSAPDVLNTLRELAEALGNDPQFATTLTKKITALTEQLNDEVERRKESDQNFIIALENETKARKEGDEALRNLIQTEKESRTEADNLLREKIDSNKAAQDAINQSVSETINELKDQSGNELTAVKALISANTANIQRNFEILQNIQSTFGDVETLIRTEVEKERTRAEVKEQELLEKINQAVADYTTKINNLTVNLTAALETEKSERQAADNALSERISSIDSNLNKEIHDRTLADQQLQSDIDKEKLARESADTALSEKLAEETQDRKDADKALEKAIEKEEADRKSAIEKEEDDRKAEDEKLSNRISQQNDALLNEANERRSADQQLQANIDNEKTEREKADNNLQASIDAQGTLLEKEKSDRAAADEQLKQEFDEKLDKVEPMTEEEVEEIYNEVYVNNN